MKDSPLGPQGRLPEQELLRQEKYNKKDKKTMNNKTIKVVKQNIFAIVAAVALVLGMGGCSMEDNPTMPSVDVESLEQSLVGLWYEEFDYADVTEDGRPFSRVQLVVKVDADHTGYICLGAYDDESDYPLAVYGGPVDAGFKWQLKADGTIVLTDPVTGDSYTLARTRGEGGSYGEKMTDVSATNMAYTDGSVTVTNDSYSGTLKKADAGKEADIEKLMAVKSPDAAPISTATTDDIGKVICSKGHIHDKVSDVEEGAVASGMIAYVGSENDAAGTGAYSSEYNHGLAVALTDVSDASGVEGTEKLAWSRVVAGACAYRRARPSASSAWFLPSAFQWQRMFIGCGSSNDFVSKLRNERINFGYGDFRKKLKDCGGTDVMGFIYWTSTDFDLTTGAFRYGFNGTPSFRWHNKSGAYYVRSAFAF